MILDTTERLGNVFCTLKYLISTTERLGSVFCTLKYLISGGVSDYHA